MTEQQPRLVFGDDGSAAADVVWLWVNNHAWPGWRLSVVTAQPPDPVAPAKEHADPHLHEWEPPVPRTLFQPAQLDSLEFLTAAADPGTVLDECADAALIAVGPRGTGFMKSMHIGTTTEWLIAAGRPLVPVVVVRSARPTRRVLLCADGTAPSRRAVDVVAGLPWIGDCHVDLLGVSDGDVDPTAGLEQAEELLTGKAKSVDAKQAAAMRATLGMDVKSVILDVADELKPDLVALGTRGQGGIRRKLLGSTASTVARNASCSVLVADAVD